MNKTVLRHEFSHVWFQTLNLSLEEYILIMKALSKNSRYSNQPYVLITITTNFYLMKTLNLLGYDFNPSID